MRLNTNEAARVMASRVIVNCRSCGSIELPGRDITVDVSGDPPTCVFKFCCPRCDTYSIRDADAHVAVLLLRAGARTTWPRVEDPMITEPGPITTDDIDDFIKRLNRLPTAEA